MMYTKGVNLKGVAANRVSLVKSDRISVSVTSKTNPKHASIIKLLVEYVGV